MLSLASRRWGTLTQAYGTAEDVPKLLEALRELEGEAARTEVWFALWRMLHRAGQSFSASYAAAPHLLEIGESRDVDELAQAMHLVASIEASRREPASEPMPPDLVADYGTAIERLPTLVAKAVDEPWTSELAQIFAGALLIGKRQPSLARAVLELGRERG